MTTTVTHLFDDYDRAQEAVRALEAAGFTSNEVSLASRVRDNASLWMTPQLLPPVPRSVPWRAPGPGSLRPWA